jgi:hypothetical protein
MIDTFLHIPGAESLPLYHMVLQLACVTTRAGSRFQVQAPDTLA